MALKLLNNADPILQKSQFYKSLRQMVYGFDNSNPVLSEVNHDPTEGTIQEKQDHLVESVGDGIYEGLKVVYGKRHVEEEAFIRKWQELWQEAETIPDQYVFSQPNPYVNDESPMELALGLIENGDIPEAILALEAEVVKNPDSSEAWTLLGKLH